MLNCRSYGTKLWKRCIFRRADGSSIRASFVDLPKDRIEDFVDFQMEYYVKEETTHQISGIPNSKAAMVEYRQWFKDEILSPSRYNVACCLEDKNNNLGEIICAYSVKLVNQTDACGNVTPANIRNSNVRNFFEILRKWNGLYPVKEIMKKYDIQRYIEDQGYAVRPDYSKCGVGTEVGVLWRLMCIEHGVKMGGAWLTSLGSQKAAANSGWETVFEISREELEKILNVKLKSTPPSYKYMIIRA